MITILYISYSSYKFIKLTEINQKVAQYENADNYYCDIDMYENEMQTQHITIWRKGDK